MRSTRPVLDIEATFNADVHRVQTAALFGPSILRYIPPMTVRRILFVQHASGLGGSCMSLLYTIQALDPTRYHAQVALIRPTPEVTDLYRDAGIEVIAWPGIDVWNHCTAVRRPLWSPRTWIDLGRVAWGWRRSQRRTLELMQAVKPDVVHLNSVVLAASAQALGQANMPHVWHVREHPPAAWLPWRTRLMRQIMQQHARQLVFISEADRHAWLRHAGGTVIANFVDMGRFDRAQSRAAARQRLRLPPDAPVILYVGGLARIKGIAPLLQSLALLAKSLPSLRCLAPGAQTPAPRGWLLRLARAILPRLGWGTTVQRAQQQVQRLALRDVWWPMPFRHDMPELLAACDALVFPATEAHFARPVIEAAAMGRPSIGSDLPGMRELIHHGVTGFLVPADDPVALAERTYQVVTDAALRSRLGDAAHALAHQNFTAQRSGARIMALYDELLAASC